MQYRIEASPPKKPSHSVLRLKTLVVLMSVLFLHILTLCDWEFKLNFGVNIILNVLKTLSAKVVTKFRTRPLFALQ